MVQSVMSIGRMVLQLTVMLLKVLAYKNTEVILVC